MNTDYVVNADGYRLGACGGESVYQVITETHKTGIVRLEQPHGPGFFEIPRRKCRGIETVPGWGRIARVYHADAVDAMRSTVNPFADAFARNGGSPWPRGSFAARVDAAIEAQ